MGALDEIAKLLVLGQEKPDFSRGDPYEGIGGIADSLGQSVIQKSRDYKLGDVVASALISGMLGGGFGQASRDYQAGQRKDYNDIILGALTGEPMPSASPNMDRSLFEQAKQQRSVLDLIDQKEQRDLRNKAILDTRKEIVSEIIKHPGSATRGLRALEMLQGGGGSDRAPLVSGSLDKGPAPKVDLFTPLEPTDTTAKPATRGAEGSLLDEVSREANKLIDEGAEPTQAYVTARELLKTKRDELKDQYKRIEESSKAGESLQSLVDQMRLAKQNAGYTGYAGQAMQSLSGLLGLASEGQHSKYAAGQELESFGKDVIQLNGKALKGPMSDRDVQLMLKSGPTLGNSPETNDAILNRWEHVANLQSQYADFMREQQRKGLPVAEAEQSWTAIRKANPYIIKENGSYRVNPSWLGDDSDSGSASHGAGGESEEEAQEAPKSESLLSDVGDVAGEFGRNAVSADGLKAMFDPESYKESFKSPEKAAETIGTGAAMTAGAIMGGEAGATLGGFAGPGAIVASPLLGLLGAGIGAGAGYLGFGATEEAASEAAGVGTDRPVIPGKQQFMEAARAGGQSVLPTGVLKGVAPVAAKVKGAASSIAKIPGNIAQTFREEIAGVKPSNVAKVLNEKPLKFFDAEGNEVPVADATEYQTALDQSLKVAEKDGFFDAVTSDPKKTKLLLAKKLQATSSEIADLHEQANLAREELHSSLSPVQQKQFPLKLDPETGRGGYSPNFKPAIDQIEQIGRTEPGMKAELEKNLAQVMGEWDATGRTYLGLQEMKSLLGGATKWTKGMSDVSNAWNQVKKTLYSTFKDTQTKAYDFLMEQTGQPEKVGALSEANQLYHAYSNLELTINKAASRSRGGFKVEDTAFKTAASALLKSYPAQRLKVAKGMDVVARGASKVGGAITTPIERAGSLLKGNEGKVAVVGSDLFSQSQDDDEIPMGVFRERTPSVLSAPVKSQRDIEAQIDADPLDSAIYEAESGRRPDAKNPKSSATGGFQLISATAKKLGVKNPRDLAENYAAYKKLRAENEQALDTKDPKLLYAAHVLGAPLVKKILAGAELSERDMELVNQFRAQAFPRFAKIYQRIAGSAEG